MFIMVEKFYILNIFCELVEKHYYLSSIMFYVLLLIIDTTSEYTYNFIYDLAVF